eukprot:10307321-Ditylum_brightwellii.AAC.1
MLLAYLDFNILFEVHMDACDTQCWVVINQHRISIAFYPHKLSSIQKNYMTTERDLLAIIKTLKEFKNILLGQQIRVYTNHKNLTYKNFSTARVIWWCMILEDYVPKFIYISDSMNVVANMLSCLDNNNGSKPPSTDNELFLLAKALTANDIQDLESKVINLFSEQPDGVTIAECHSDKEDNTV